jgi:protein-S-isoprenylcysteine O-methyltransferase Ste14
MDLSLLPRDLAMAWLIVGSVTFVALLFVNAPYGRHVRAGWGPTIPNRIGWLVMELPMVVVFALCFVAGSHTESITAWVFLAMWQSHYVHRALVYPFGLKGDSKRMPVLIAALAFVTNIVCSYMNGRYLFEASGGYQASWLSTPQFLLGATFFVGGYAINRRADHALRNLREADQSGYRIPSGGLYRWISCPNYLGEIIEWIGWAVATWSLPGLAFATWTMANLLPRARAHHAWYRQQFPDYPPERKALLPGLW